MTRPEIQKKLAQVKSCAGATVVNNGMQLYAIVVIARCVTNEDVTRSHPIGRFIVLIVLPVLVHITSNTDARHPPFWLHRDPV